MRALVKTARGDGFLELRAVPPPVPGPGYVTVAVSLAGICGTDVHILHDEFPYWPPVTLGHEFTGTVEAVGPDVPPALVGTRVVCEPHAGACGTCDLCRRGHAELCPTKRSPGWGVDGAFAASVAVPAHLLHAVPDGVPPAVAVLAEPTAVALTAVQRAGLEAGDTVLVIGPGPLGLLAGLVARTLGAGSVVVAGRRDSPRLAFAERAGLIAARTAEEARRAIADRTAGRGADLVIDAAGTEEAIRLAIEAVRRRGRMIGLGFGGESTVAVPWDVAVSRAITLTFSTSSSRGGWNGALEVLARNQATLADMVTVFPLAAWADAFAAVAARTVTKAVLDPSAEA